MIRLRRHTPIALLIAAAISLPSCGRKLLPDASLTMPAPPAGGRRAEADQHATAVPEAPKDFATKPRANRAAPATRFAKPASSAPVVDTSAGAMGTTGSVSIVSVKPEGTPGGASGSVTVQSRTVHSTRKPILAGASVLAALVAAAFRFVPRRYPT